MRAYIQGRNSKSQPYFFQHSDHPQSSTFKYNLRFKRLFHDMQITEVTTVNLHSCQSCYSGLSSPGEWQLLFTALHTEIQKACMNSLCRCWRCLLLKSDFYKLTFSHFPLLCDKVLFLVCFQFVKITVGQCMVNMQLYYICEDFEQRKWHVG